MLLGLISDTHGFLNARVFDIFANVDHILHAGDVGDDRILDELAAIAPLNAVSGNVDGSPTTRRPLRFSETLGGLRICMTHGHLLDSADYNASAAQLFAAEKPSIILHGHSHIAKNERFGDIAIINPGAACRARFRDISSVAILEIEPAGAFHCRFYNLTR